MATPLNFQQVILKLHEFWAAQGCVIWEPYNIQLGAGTNNPATLLRVLGPEPWRVAYVEPSIRPDDGRFGENPNRMQRFYQYQVILKPEPGNPQELYLQSLQALGLNPREQDIRFVEDNWESPVLGAWGLGWEVWLNGQEITQYTYFQQAGALDLNPVSVEITYGLERIVSALQGKNSVWEIEWVNDITYGDVLLTDEVEHCRYYFDVADVDALRKVYNTYEREVYRALEAGTVISAYDYVQKCSHLFNVLDTRGAIGVTERATFFKQMRDMTRASAQAYLAKREALNYPLMKMANQWAEPAAQTALPLPPAPIEGSQFLLELGVEEMPPDDVYELEKQLFHNMVQLFKDLRIEAMMPSVYSSPRRIAFTVGMLSQRQTDFESVVKGPPADRAFKDGKPTPAAEGFARSKGISVDELRIEEVDGGRYVMATVKEKGRPTTEVLAEHLPKILAGLRVNKMMRWNRTQVAFSRPIRWIVALFGDNIIPFEFAGVASGNVSQGLRPYGSPPIEIDHAGNYHQILAPHQIMVNNDFRREAITTQIDAALRPLKGNVIRDVSLLNEVVNLVEYPTVFVGQFDAKYLQLPRDVLITVMKKHQRYFAVQDAEGHLMPYFVAVRNGDNEHIQNVIHGNEHVLKARFADANYFFQQDLKKPLIEHLPRLKTLTFHEKLGSMYDKNQRVAGLVRAVGELLKLPAKVIQIAEEAAKIAKADLATEMVVEMTSLQGIMGREYALREGISPDIADTIFEHWQPRTANDELPESKSGQLLALVDKLDSLVGLFSAGITPKATSDPYGLRRAALGVILIMVVNDMDVSFRDILPIIGAAQPIPFTDETQASLLDFLRGRLDAWIEDERHYARDAMNAVLAEQAHNPFRATRDADELEQWTERKAWPKLLDNFARCIRITRTETTTYTLNPEGLVEPQEKALYEAYQKAAAKLKPTSGIKDVLKAFEPMIPAIEDFFKTVMVNVDDVALRQNRIALLQAIGNLQKGYADLSQMTGF